MVLISARDGTGIVELVARIDDHRAALIDGGRLGERRRLAREAQIVHSLARRYGVFGIERFGGQQALLDRIRKADAGSALSLLDELGRQIESALANPGNTH